MRWGTPSVVVVLLAVALLTGTGVAEATATDGAIESDAATVAAQNAADGEPNATDASSNATGDESNAAADESNASLAPGAQLAGVLAVQRTEITGELDRRSFDTRLAAAESNDSRARVVSRELNQSRDRLDELRSRLSSLEAARENGTISQGRYRAEAAQLTAEIRSVERQLDRTSDAAASLPEEAKRANGIDGDELERLRGEARNLSGPAVATAARGVVSNAGNGFGPGGANGERGADRGPPAENAGDGGPPANAGAPASTAAGNGSLPANAGGGERPENRSDGGPPADADDAAPNERAGANGSGSDAAPTDVRPGGTGDVAPERAADGANPAAGPGSDEDTATGVTETNGGTGTDAANESAADAANP